MTDAISLVDVKKAFGPIQALDGVTLHVAKGEVHGFLGPNGAGKSTTIRVLLGLLRADDGRSSIFGMDPWADAVSLHRRLAYVPGDVVLWPELTGGEAIDLLAKLRGGFNQRKRDQLCERFDFDPTRKGRTYSKGNRQKVALIAAFSSNVDLLLLDEPTAGLDPLMEVVFEEVVREEHARGTTVLLSSHLLTQVENLADRISIIRQGRIVETGTLEDLRHLTRTRIEARLDAPPTDLERWPGVHNIAIDGPDVAFDIDGQELGETIGRLHHLGIRSLVCQPPSLEQLFMRHYGDDLAAAAGGAPR